MQGFPAASLTSAPPRPFAKNRASATDESSTLSIKSESCDISDPTVIWLTPSMKYTRDSRRKEDKGGLIPRGRVEEVPEQRW